MPSWTSITWPAARSYSPATAPGYLAAGVAAMDQLPAPPRAMSAGRTHPAGRRWGHPPLPRSMYTLSRNILRPGRIPLRHANLHGGALSHPDNHLILLRYSASAWDSRASIPLPGRAARRRLATTRLTGSRPSPRLPSRKPVPDGWPGEPQTCPWEPPGWPHSHLGHAEGARGCRRQEPLWTRPERELCPGSKISPCGALFPVIIASRLLPEEGRAGSGPLLSRQCEVLHAPTTTSGSRSRCSNAAAIRGSRLWPPFRVSNVHDRNRRRQQPGWRE